MSETINDVRASTQTRPAASRWRRMAVGAAALGAVMGPGLIAGLSDDDAAGITTYSSMGASYGYQLLWVLGVSTIALILFQDLGARIGVVTGQGLAGLIRQRYGARAGVGSIGALVLAHLGTTCAEFAGIAAGSVGIVALGAGVFYGLQARSLSDDLS